MINDLIVDFRCRPLAIPLIYFFFFFLTIACSMEVPADKSNNTDDFSVQKAKEIFARDYSRVKTTTKSGEMQVYYRDRWMFNVGGIAPQWECRDISFDEAFQRMDGLSQMTFEIRCQNHFYAIDYDENLGDEFAVPCYTRLLIVDNPDTHVNNSFLVFFVPKESFLRSVDYDFTDYLTVGLDHYSGVILFTNLDGNIIRANKYDNGMLLAEIRLNDAQDEDEFINLWYGIAYDVTPGIRFEKGFPGFATTRSGTIPHGDGDDDDTCGGWDNEYWDEWYESLDLELFDPSVFSPYVVFDNDYSYVCDYDTMDNERNVLEASICIADSIDPMPEFFDEIDDDYHDDGENQGGMDGGDQGDEIGDVTGGVFYEPNPEESQSVLNSLHINARTTNGGQISTEDKSKLDSCLAHISKNPIGYAVLSKLVDYGRTIEIIIKNERFATQQWNECDATTSRLSLIINYNVNSYQFGWVLLEELFHICQLRANSQMTTGEMEFEAKVLMSIATSRQYCSTANVVYSQVPDNTSHTFAVFYEDPNEANYNDACNRLMLMKYPIPGNWNPQKNYLPDFNIFSNLL